MALQLAPEMNAGWLSTTAKFRMIHEEATTPGPEGPDFWPSFRGLKPPAPSGFFRLLL
jgi:hypothetical protein